MCEVVITPDSTTGLALTDSIITKIEMNLDTKEVVVVGDKNRFVLNYLSSKEQFQFSKRVVRAKQARML